MEKPVADMRVNYLLNELHENEVHEDPVEQFRRWFKEATNSKLVKEPNAMTLCTCSKDGFPSGRIVLLKV